MQRHNWHVQYKVLPFFYRGKSLEVRLNTPFFQAVKIGDVIIFNHEVWRSVPGIRVYTHTEELPAFEAMLKAENPESILPGHSPDEILQLIRYLYPPDRERLGARVFDLDVVPAELQVLA